MTQSISSWLDWPRQDREKLASLLAEKTARDRKTATDQLLAYKDQGLVEPETVALFAWLFMTTDEGQPIQPAAHHWLWLRLWCNLDIRRLLIVAPPESAKTTWLAAYIGTQIAFWPERPRIYGAASNVVAARRTLAIRNMVEDPRFHEVFPEVQRAKGMAYETHQWSVANWGTPHPGRIHPTLSSYGTDGPVTGARAREAIGDDILDERNTRTAYMRDHVHNWLHSSFLSRLVSRTGRALVVGTSWHHDDPYSRMKRDGSWVICHLPILAEQGSHIVATLTYPDTYDGERLGEPIETDQKAEVTV